MSVGTHLVVAEVCIYLWRGIYGPVEWEWQMWGRGSPCPRKEKTEAAPGHHIGPTHTALPDSQPSSTWSQSDEQKEENSVMC